jgi:hypothetical protein
LAVRFLSDQDFNARIVAGLRDLIASAVTAEDLFDQVLHLPL